MQRRVAGAFCCAGSLSRSEVSKALIASEPSEASDDSAPLRREIGGKVCLTKPEKPGGRSDSKIWLNPRAAKNE